MKTTTDLASPRNGKLITEGTGELIQKTSTQQVLGLISDALNKGIEPEKMGKFLDLWERCELREQNKAFIAALHAFKKDMPVVFRTKQGSVMSYRGKSTATHYAAFEDMAKIAAEHLDEHGFTYNFDTDYIDNMVKVTCRAQHRGGGIYETSLIGELQGKDDQKSPLNQTIENQKVVTYLKRQTFKNAFGIVEADPDLEERLEKQRGVVDEDKLRELLSLVKESGANEAKFKQAFHIEKLEELPDCKFNEARLMLKNKLLKAEAVKNSFEHPAKTGLRI